MERCKVCGKKLSGKKDLYCSRHAKVHLKALEASGYLEPLRYQTVDGTVVLAKRRFLTLDQETEAFDENSNDS